MYVIITFIGIRENRRINEYKIVLEEKNSGKKLILDITFELVSQIKRILTENNYNGIFEAFRLISEKFGFSLKKTIIDLKNKVSVLYLYDTYGNNFQLNTNLIDGIILSTYNTSEIYIEDSAIKMCKNKTLTTYSSIDLAKYTLDELYNMLERAKFDDSFLEEAIRIRDEIKMREKKKK